MLLLAWLWDLAVLILSKKSIRCFHVWFKGSCDSQGRGGSNKVVILNAPLSANTSMSFVGCVGAASFDLCAKYFNTNEDASFCKLHVSQVTEV